jgi:hypothetical protein
VIQTPENATPRCTAVVDLISRVFRPYLFMVTVTGEYPHNCVRRFRVAAPSEDSAAMKGLELFVAEFTPKTVVERTATQVPKAKLQ